MNNNQILLQSNFRHPQNVQPEGLIYKIIPCQVTVFRSFCFYFATLLTCGLLYLVSRWDLRIFLYLRARSCSPLRATHFLIIGQDKSQTLVIPTRQNDSILIEYRLYRYIYTNLFEPIETNFHKMKGTQIRNYTVDRHQQIQQFGLNNTEIPDKGIFKTLIEEVLSPFYMFQFCSVLLWFFAEYQRYAIVILLTSLVSIVITFTEQRRSFRRLQSLSKFQIPVQVKDEVEQISSTELVPGDKILIKDGMTMPCDAILLEGQAIFNEAMLTGESIPVVKSGIPNTQLQYDPNDEGKQCTLFAGTTCLEIKGYACAMVTQTSFNTMKGELIRSIMFPVQNSFKFYADSMKFVGIMAILAVIGFAVTVPNKIVFLMEGSISTWEFINEGLDLITITVPPALPTCLQIGVSIALARLQKLSIFCISPQKVNISGKISVMCFDKTGTLTEEGLDLYGVRAVGYQQRELTFTKIYHDCQVLEQDSNLSFSELCSKTNNAVCGVSLLEVMGSCHGLSYVKGRMIGDPLEIKMFEATKYHLCQESEYLSTCQWQDNEIHIVKRFEFSSKLQRMSVIVKHGPQYKVHTKGSPEKLRSLCLVESIPKNFHKILDFYAQSGFRVLALGSKIVEFADMEREDAETNLHFLGFVIMENKLKSITTPIISQLHEAHIRTIMVTGDNVLTAISVARQCGIIKNQHVYLGELSEKKVNGKYFVTWRDLEHSQNVLNGDSLNPEGELADQINPQDPELVEECEEIKYRKSMQEEDYTTLLKNKSLLEEPPPRGSSLSKVYTDGDFTEEQPWEEHQNYVLAISGGAFMHMYKNGSQATFNHILEKSLVYARMRPDEKANLIIQLQKQGDKLVGFCGDGANDCAALKSADAGISLSQAEASIAAPFTSTIQDISCVPHLLSQGRGALTTSFACFKFMALYSMIQFTQVTILYLRQSNLTDNQYLYNDLFTIFPLSMTMGFTQAAQINKYIPGSSLISIAVLGSVIGQTIIQLLFQLGIYFLLLQQSWFISNEELNANNVNDDSLKVCFENTTLFIYGNFQYIFIALAFSNGRPFRKPFYTNYMFVFSLLFLLFLAIVFLLWRIQFIDDIMGFVFIAPTGEQIPESWMTLIGGIAIVNFIVTIAYDRIVVPKLSKQKQLQQQQ